MASPASVGTACSSRCAERLPDFLLPLRPFPPVHWWCASLAEGACLDIWEHYPKRTFRNRLVLATASGPASLTIPVERRGSMPRPQVDTLRVVSNADKLWRAVQTAYGAAPYFEEMAPELEVLFRRGPKSLGEWNLETLRWSAEWLQCKVPQSHEAAFVDRSGFSHEANDVMWKAKAAIALQPWPHIWTGRGGLDFGELSVMDLLLHCGPEASRWITPLPPNGSLRPE